MIPKIPVLPHRISHSAEAQLDQRWKPKVGTTVQCEWIYIDIYTVVLYYLYGSSNQWGEKVSTPVAFCSFAKHEPQVDVTCKATHFNLHFNHRLDLIVAVLCFWAADFQLGFWTWTQISAWFLDGKTIVLAWVAAAPVCYKAEEFHRVWMVWI